tara:strand:- start:831 stop:1106 length:276 start_codon:yes stop_codon:yes gene_type:complete
MEQLATPRRLRQQLFLPCAVSAAAIGRRPAKAEENDNQAKQCSAEFFAVVVVFLLSSITAPRVFRKPSRSRRGEGAAQGTPSSRERGTGRV